MFNRFKKEIESQKEIKQEPKIISQVVKGNIEITTFQTSKPILPAKHTSLADIRKQAKSR